MKTFAVLLLAAVASAASVPGVPGVSGVPGAHISEADQGAHAPGARRLRVFGSPALAARSAEAGGPVHLDGVLSSEAQGWRGFYDKPVVLAMQNDNKPELVSFLVKGGLASLPHSEDLRFLHSALRSGDDKVGILLSAAKFVNAPQVEMPISKIFLPKDYTLAASARLHSQNHGIPTMLLLNMADLRGFDLNKLALIGDFHVFDDAVKVASDVATPAVGRMSDVGIKRLVQHSYAGDFTPKISPAYEYEYIIPSSSVPKIIPQSEVSKYSLLI